MADREEQKTGETSTGMTQEWVPAALRGASESVPGPAVDPDDEAFDFEPPNEVGVDGGEEDEDPGVGPDLDSDLEADPDFGPALDPGSTGETASDALRRRIEEASRQAMEQTAQIVAGEARSRFEADVARLEESTQGRLDDLAERLEVAESQQREHFGLLTAEIDTAIATMRDEATEQFGERLAAIEQRLGETNDRLQSAAETTDEVSRVMQRSGEQASERIGEVEETLEKLSTLQASGLESLTERLERLESEAATERGDLTKRVGATEEGFVELRESETKRRSESEERLATLARGFGAEVESNRLAVDALAESVGTKSGEISRRQIAVEQGLGELHLEIDGSRTKSDELARVLKAAMEKLSGATQARLGELEVRTNESIEALIERLAGQATSSLDAEAGGNQRLVEVAEEVTRLRDVIGDRMGDLDGKHAATVEAVDARLELVERRLGEAGAERVERLAPLERGLEELSGGLERTRAAFIQREKERHGSLQSSIDEIAARLDARLARADSALTSRIEALEEARGQAPAPVGAIPETLPEEADGPRPAAQVPVGPVGPLVPIPPQGPVDVNEVTFEQLRSIGLSVTQASRLLDLRSSRGRFSSLEELEVLPGFPETLRKVLGTRLSIDEDLEVEA